MDVSKEITPVKKYKPACLTCGERSASRSHNLQDTKCVAENIQQKLEVVTGKKLVIGASTNICRPCLKKVISSYEFVVQAIRNIDTSTAVNTKRCHHSPLVNCDTAGCENATTEFIPPNHSTPSKQPRKVRKRLDISSTSSLDEDPFLPLSVAGVSSIDSYDASVGLSSIGSGEASADRIVMDSSDVEFVQEETEFASDKRADIHDTDDRIQEDQILWEDMTIGDFFSLEIGDSDTTELETKQVQDINLDSTAKNSKQQIVLDSLEKNCVTSPCINENMTDAEVAELKQKLDKKEVDIKGLAECISKNAALYVAVKNIILDEVRESAVSLSKRKPGKLSVLSKYRPMEKLESTNDFLLEILDEMRDKCPFLLDTMLAIIQRKDKNGNMQKLSTSFFGPLITAYSILLHVRDQSISAFQRLMTVTCTKGGASDDLLFRLNKLGIALSPSSKLRILNECGPVSKRRIINRLKQHYVVKITGDNLDIYIRTQHQSADHGHRDLHLFTSNLLFFRTELGPLSNVYPQPITDLITFLDFLLTQDQTQILEAANGIVLGRLFADNFKCFKWMKDKGILPKHTPHSQSEAMNKKSEVYPLPIMMKNEAKYEDCCEIMDMYEEQLCGYYTEAFGDTEILDEKQSNYGGDCLTQLRMTGAKALRLLAPHPRKSHKHLHPITCEFWHVKQDFLAKAYLSLKKAEDQAQPGTINFFKVLYGHTDVNGKVKSNFKAHWEFFIFIGQYMLLEQGLEYFGMDDYDSMPTKNWPPVVIDDLSDAQKGALAGEILAGFLRHHKYGTFTLDEVNEPYFQMNVEVEGVENPVPVQFEDKLYNYCSNLCHWALHLMQVDDMTKEGDIDRLVINAKYNMPFFYSHSTRSKYFPQNMDFVLKTEFMLSPQMKRRVLEGCFVNVKGGPGNNVEADLVQEHSVRNRKDMIRQLGANKTDEAIRRVTDAADAVASMVEQLDNVLDVKKSSSRHAKRVSEEDCNDLKRRLRELRIFRPTPDRVCLGHDNTPRSPFQKIDKLAMRTHMDKIKDRLVRGQVIEVDLEDNEDNVLFLDADV